MAQPVNPLPGILAARIREEGPLTVADYMTAALIEPGAGYYMTGDPFGADGDFITAPEVSQIFGELIGLWCAQCWQGMGSPASINLVELGPGRGTLMADALRAATVLPAFKDAIAIHLVEASPSLMARQRETLSSYDVSWHGDLSSLPRAPMIVIANEFFDALPVRQFEKIGHEWRERLVTLSPLATPNAPAFTFTNGAVTDEGLAMIPSNLRDAPHGTLLEVSPAMEAVAGDLASRLSRDGGIALVIDYGRTTPDSGWSLQALRQHTRHEPLVSPGQADLTVHVDFPAVTDAARAAGARAWGPVTQATFLNALGIRERAEALSANATGPQRDAIESGVQRLTASDQMGELFNVLAFGHPELSSPAGLPISSADRADKAS